MMKRGLAAGLLAGVAALGLAAPAGAAPECSGVEITIGTFNPPFIGGPAIAHAKTWAEKTGGKTNVVTFPFGELYTKYMTPMATGQHAFDVLMGAPAWLGDFAPYLSEMPAAIRQRARTGTISPRSIATGSWSGTAR
jgi:multiple sugar transport system substrate-binding protein